MGKSANKAGGRRLVTAAVVVVSLVIVVGCVVWFLRQDTASVGVISDQQYQAVKIGDQRSSVLKRLGAPAQGLDVSKFPPARSGQQCDYYSESGAVMDPSVFRFCFAGGRLVSKESSDELQQQPSPSISLSFPG
ncbi:hypothetical protein ACFYZJ_38685 [Streptomyces sp. NPDC001848]|uniref:hypothetical protein n=1 Tax=Streptomyces sp. NPDC001848 TaxID=3364618 RepID=UPI0036879301